MANHHEIVLVEKYYCTVVFPQNPLTQTLQIHISESKPANLFLIFFLNSCSPYINGPTIVSGLIPCYIPCYKLRLSSVCLGTRDGFPSQSRRSTLTVFSTKKPKPPPGQAKTCCPNWEIVRSEWCMETP